LYDTSPTLIPLRRIDSEIIRFGRAAHHLTVPSIVITGATGQLGRLVVEQLLAAAELGGRATNN